MNIDLLREGCVIPACPLPLHQDGSWAEEHQRALIRYYVESGAGGLAVGVHSTQFEIREPKHGLFRPLLKLASGVLDEASADLDLALPIKIAGVCGLTAQAVDEAEFASACGYDACLLSLTALNALPEEHVLDHCRRISETLPLIGFYLQPAVGGRFLGYEFWRRFMAIDNVVAIKVAPFDRYGTLDVVRAVIDAEREDIAIYTGNDDNIVVDLLTEFEFQGRCRYIAGGLLGQWGVWTSRAVRMLRELQSLRAQQMIPKHWLSTAVKLTDANAAIFDAANGFAGCIPGIMEVLRRQGLAPSNRCLNPREVMSAGQREEIDRVYRDHPELTDDEWVHASLDRWLR